MGLNRDSIGFLVTARRLGVDFEQTLMLGRQALIGGYRALRAGFRDAGLSINPTVAHTMMAQSSGYAEPLFAGLGAVRCDSLDVDDYENSTILHDLNQQLPEPLQDRYGLVLDGGTLEHVFNYPAAVRNALEAVRHGGHFAAITPINGYAGHGFYQLSPEVFYQVLGPENGFRILCMLLKPLHWRSQWRLVPDPTTVGHRVLWRGAWPTLIYVLAQRIETMPMLAKAPMQSDYVAMWNRTTRDSDRPRKFNLSPVMDRLPLPMQEIRESFETWRTSKTSLPVVHLTDLVTN